MTGAAIVSEASAWAEYLVRRNFKGPGDTVEAAMDRTARRHRLPYRLLWSLRYRKPKDLMASAYKALHDAYEDECLRQEAKLRHEIETAKRLMGDAATDHPTVLAAERALAALEGSAES